MTINDLIARLISEATNISRPFLNSGIKLFQGVEAKDRNHQEQNRAEAALSTDV